MNRNDAHFRRILASAALLALLLTSLIPVPAQAAKNPVPEASKAVVHVYVEAEDGGYVGTAFGVGTPGKDTDVFITNWHVIWDDKAGAPGKIFLMLDGAKLYDTSTMVPCELLYTPKTGYPDFAVIRTRRSIRGVKALPLLPAESVEVGTKIFVLGFPQMVDNESLNPGILIEDITVTDGVVSRFMEYKEAAEAAGPGAAKVIVHTAQTAGGNSGGPVITEDGAVIGIHTYGWNGGEVRNTKYQGAYYIDYAMEALDDLDLHYEIYEEETQPAWLVPAVTAGGAAIVLLVLAAVIRSLRKKDSKKPNSSESKDSSVFYITGINGRFAGQRIPISGSGVVLGREQNCIIKFPEGTPGISRRHCKLAAMGGSLIITDLGSRYGTYVDGKKIPPNTPVILVSGISFYLGTADNAFAVC